MPKCPKCLGEDGTLYIYAVPCTIEVFDDGAEQVGDIEWTDDNNAACSNACGWKGKVKDLVTP